MILIEEFSEIQNRIGIDLSWYLGYYALHRAQDILNISLEEAEETEARTSLFYYTAAMAAENLLSQRLFHGKKIRMTRPCCMQMIIHMSKSISHIPTFGLSAYLEYLDAWAGQDLDWNTARPVSMQEMEIIHYD